MYRSVFIKTLLPIAYPLHALPKQNAVWVWVTQSVTKFWYFAIGITFSWGNTHIKLCNALQFAKQSWLRTKTELYNLQSKL